LTPRPVRSPPLKHAVGAGLAIDYRTGVGEHLPADDACANIAYRVDVVEHVADVSAVVAEAARVLTPGGLFLLDTINRTMISKLVLIKLCQDWPMTAWVPPGLHDWNQFITPAELRDVLARHQLREEGPDRPRARDLAARAHPPRAPGERGQALLRRIRPPLLRRSTPRHGIGP